MRRGLLAMKYPSRRIGGLRQAGAFANRSARGFCGMVKNLWIRLGRTERNGSDEIARHARGSGFPHGVLMSAKRLAGPRFPRYLTHVRTKEALRTALRASFAKYQVKWGGKSCLAVEWAFRLLLAPGSRRQGLTRVQEIERMIPSGLLPNACRATVFRSTDSAQAASQPSFTSARKTSRPSWTTVDEDARRSIFRYMPGYASNRKSRRQSKRRISFSFPFALRSAAGDVQDASRHIETGTCIMDVK